jgi:diamine N-acetyltransferase
MIRGEKVVLRPVDLKDAPNLTKWLNDKEVTAYLPFWMPATVKAEEEWIKAEDPRMTRFAIDTSDGTHIGQCTLRASGGHERVSEVGLFIGEKEYWSQGYGTDAVLTLCTFGFAYQNLDRIALHVVADNAAAIRSYEKAGFQHEGRLRRHRFVHGCLSDLVVMGILREEFRERFPERWPSEE